VIRTHSLSAWQALQEGKPNPLASLLAADERISRWVETGSLPALLDASAHVGDAVERAHALAAQIRATIQTGGASGAG
jgi:adenylosuccinate lyase